MLFEVWFGIGCARAGFAGPTVPKKEIAAAAAAIVHSRFIRVMLPGPVEGRTLARPSVAASLRRRIAQARTLIEGDTTVA